MSYVVQVNENGVTTTDIFALYNGTWNREGNNWTFEGAHSMVVPMANVFTYKELLNKLYAALSVDTSLFELKLEVAYQCVGQPFPPITITDDGTVAVYLRQMPIYHRTPLCVTVIAKNTRTIPEENTRTIPEENTHIRIDEPRIYHSFGPARGNTENGLFYSQQFNKGKANVVDDPPMFDLNEGFNNELHGLPYENKKRKRNMSVNERYYKDMPPPDVDYEKKSNSFFKLPKFTDVDLLETGKVDIKGYVDAEGIYEGRYFDDKMELKKAVAKYAIKNNFDWVVKDSDQSQWYIRCSDVNCRWRLRAKKLTISPMFKICKIHDVHTCEFDLRGKDHRQARPFVIADIIKDKIVNDGTKYLPRHIIADVNSRLGLEFSYEKAWRCKEEVLKLVRGAPEASYGMLPSYLCMLTQKNYGTLTDVVTKDGGEFRYCFFALGASVRGFKSCIRPVICVDGTFLTSKFGGTLLVAVALDADNHLYLIAVAVVDSENNDSWTYFMHQLRMAIGTIDNLVFVSDRHRSIPHALDIVFPEAHHCACYYHIKQNVHQKYKTDACDADIYAAAYAYRQSDYDRHLMRIRATSKEIAKFLDDIGKHKWALSHCKGKRYNIMTSNYAESLNNTTKDARTYPVTSMLEFIRSLLQKWFNKRREAANKCTDTLAPGKEKQLRQVMKNAKGLRSKSINRHEVQVFDNKGHCVVNLLKKECTCGVFQIEEMPCIHAVAACRSKHGLRIYDFCSKYFTIQSWKDAYAESIYPCGNEDEWNVPDSIKNIRVTVPVPKPTIGRPKKKQGRPKTKRILSQGERLVKHRRCSRCKGYAHNRATCTAII